LILLYIYFPQCSCCEDQFTVSLLGCLPFFTDPGLLKIRLSSLICCCGFASTLKPRLTNTRLIQTIHFYGQFALSLGKALTFLRFLSIRTLVGGKGGGGEGGIESVRINRVFVEWSLTVYIILKVLSF